MPNKRIGSLLTLLALATIGAASPAAAQEREAEVALQQAMHVEQVEGDLELAIQLYRDIVAQHGDTRAVAAFGTVLREAGPYRGDECLPTLGERVWRSE